MSNSKLTSRQTTASSLGGSSSTKTPCPTYIFRKPDTQESQRSRRIQSRETESHYRVATRFISSSAASPIPDTTHSFVPQLDTWVSMTAGPNRRMFPEKDNCQSARIEEPVFAGGRRKSIPKLHKKRQEGLQIVEGKCVTKEDQKERPLFGTFTRRKFSNKNKSTALETDESWK
eukprot:173205_1